MELNREQIIKALECCGSKRYIGVCDICGTETPRCSSWEKARAYISRNWLTKKVDGAYEHYCEDCKRQIEKEQKKR